jgi:hypothetical protein
MADRLEGLPLKSLVLVPALVTLAVTLVRLAGELLRLPSALFSREAGGAAAIVGIVWLVPIFGVVFALKLLRLGHAPSGGWRALGISVVAFFLLPASIAVALRVDFPVRVAVLGLGSIAALVVAYSAWPALGRTLLAYGLAARIPVAALMLVAMLGNWGTHYELGPPTFPEMAVVPKWFWIGLLPQLTFWLGFTVAVGSIFGASTALVARRRAVIAPQASAATH